MHKNGDIYVIVLIVIVLVGWLFILLKRWLYTPSKVRLSFLDEVVPPTGEAVQLLEESGYEVLSGKLRIPVTMKVDQKTLQSRYFIDYIAKRENEIYIVKLAKERQPMDWTGSAVRERLLPYYLLYDEIYGVLYVDTNRQSVKKITFDFD